jgi:hypothetical protein
MTKPGLCRELQSATRRQKPTNFINCIYNLVSNIIIEDERKRKINGKIKIKEAALALK